MMSCILLSAGLSSRFGSHKALARLEKIPLIEHLQKMLISSKVSEIVVVLGASFEEIEPHIFKHEKIVCVRNPDYRLGQISSFKTGLKNVSANSLAALLLPVDYPLIKTETIDTLCDFFLARRPSIVIPTYQNRKGHPPIFHKKLTKQLLEWDASIGLNRFAEQMKPQTILSPVEDPGILLTFNTPAEFAELKKIYENEKSLDR